MDDIFEGDTVALDRQGKGLFACSPGWGVSLEILRGLGFMLDLKQGALIKLLYCCNIYGKVVYAKKKNHCSWLKLVRKC